MGILGSIVKGVTGKSNEPTDPKAIGGIIEMLTSGETGGIQGLIRKLTEGGLGNVVNSWISKEPNQPVEPKQLENALGGDLIGKFASKMGVSSSEASTHLSKLLPTVIDKLTPDGKLPESGSLGNVQNLLKKFF
jgi:uncharacterized protein YidB (DUF937 family)